MGSFSPQELTAILLSLRVAGVATIASLPVGIALGWLLARCRFPGKTILDGVVHLPLVMPPVASYHWIAGTVAARRLAGRP